MDWILVAAISPHNDISWLVGHTVEGVEWVGIEDTHTGAHVISVLPPEVTWNAFRLASWQMLSGITPTKYAIFTDTSNKCQVVLPLKLFVSKYKYCNWVSDPTVDGITPRVSNTQIIKR